ncbi:hypothetical protein RSJ2_4166 (plasmid) [Clostridium botulinum]|nr:hypothetical protein RSJ2_4166 [Clostridium botulinum]
MVHVKFKNGLCKELNKRYFQEIVMGAYRKYVVTYKYL